MRRMRSISLIVLLALIFTTAFTVATIPETSSLIGAGQCFGVPPDAKDEVGTDGWHIYAPEGFVFYAAKVKAGKDCYDDGNMYRITGIGTDHVSAEVLCEDGGDCPEISHLEGMWEKEPDIFCEVTVFQEGEWSDWYPDPEKEDWECHSRWNTWVDAEYPDRICDTEEEVECQELPPEYCLVTTPIYGEWGLWYPHLTDETQECHDQEVTYVDAEHPDRICDVGVNTVCRTIPQPEDATYSIGPACAPKGGLGGLNVEIVGQLTFNLVDDGFLTKSGTFSDLSVGEYSYYVEVDEGYVLVGESDGTFEIKWCPNPPPKDPPTGMIDSPVFLPGIGGFVASISLLLFSRRRKSI